MYDDDDDDDDDEIYDTGCNYVDGPMPNVTKLDVPLTDKQLLILSKYSGKISFILNKVGLESLTISYTRNSEGLDVNFSSIDETVRKHRNRLKLSAAFIVGYWLSLFIQWYFQ